MTDLVAIKKKLPETMILEFLDANEDCTIDLVMLVELGVYSRKDHAVRALKRNFEEGLEFSPLKGKASPAGLSADIYVLTSDCFKEMCMLADTPTGKLVRTYYIEVERRWKKEQREKLHQLETTQRQELEPLNADIEQLADEVVGIIFEMIWKSADCITNIKVKTAREQKKLKREFEKGISRDFLFSIATEAIGDVGHNAEHQHKEVIKQIRLRVEPYKEYFVSKLLEWQELQALSQPTQPLLPPTPVYLRPRDQRRQIEEFLDELDSMTAQARKERFFASPKFSDYEKSRYVGWSGRAIAKYLELPESGYKTTQKIMKEREDVADNEDS